MCLLQALLTECTQTEERVVYDRLISFINSREIENYASKYIKIIVKYDILHNIS